MPFAPNGLITLSTDFGIADPFVGIVKGRILSRFPAARITDLTHGVPAGRADLAGFWLARAWREFPPGSVHLAVVDPGVGTERRVILALAEGRLLLGPDNGLLPETLRDCATVRWIAMSPDLHERLGLGPLSRTFHGRDLFAPLAALLAAGELPPEAFGCPADPADPRPLPTAVRDMNGVCGRVLLADHFGNLFTNIDAGLIAGYTQAVVETGQLQLPLLATYGDVPPGTPLALINAFGLVELAVNGGNAAQVLAIVEGSPVLVREGFSA